MATKTKGKRITRDVRPAKFSRFNQAQTDVIAKALGQIEADDGEVRVSRLLEVAASPSHPLHELLYADDDKEAARKWRVELARRICRAVRVVYVDDVGEIVADAPMLVSVTKSEKSGETVIRTRRYISIERAFADPGVRESMIEEALRDADRWAQRHSSLVELKPIFEAINSAKRGRKSRR